MKRTICKKAFTSKEIIVVSIVIALLLMLVIPRFLSQRAEAQLSRIEDDTSIIDSAVNEYLIKNRKLPDDWETKDKAELILDVSKNKIHSADGQVLNISPGTYKIVDLSFFRDRSSSKLKGDFIANNRGDVYYIEVVKD